MSVEGMGWEREREGKRERGRERRGKEVKSEGGWREGGRKRERKSKSIFLSFFSPRKPRGHVEEPGT